MLTVHMCVCMCVCVCVHNFVCVGGFQHVHVCIEACHVEIYVYIVLHMNDRTSYIPYVHVLIRII